MSEHPNPRDKRAERTRDRIVGIEADLRQSIDEAREHGEERIARKLERCLHGLAVAHGLLDEAREMLAAGGYISPFSGGTEEKPDPNGPPRP
ncbi:MAG: hypothetical protein ACK4RV_10135 [Caulobacter sp.]